MYIFASFRECRQLSGRTIRKLAVMTFARIRRMANVSLAEFIQSLRCVIQSEHEHRRAFETEGTEKGEKDQRMPLRPVNNGTVNSKENLI